MSYQIIGLAQHEQQPAATVLPESEISAMHSVGTQHILCGSGLISPSKPCIGSRGCIRIISFEAKRFLVVKACDLLSYLATFHVEDRISSAPQKVFAGRYRDGSPRGRDFDSARAQQTCSLPYPPQSGPACVCSVQAASLIWPMLQQTRCRAV